MSWGRILIVEASSRKYLALDIVLLAWKLLLSRVQKVWRANTTTTICGSLVAEEECGVLSLDWHAEAALRSRQKQRVNQTTTQRAARHVDGPARFLTKEIQSILALSRKYLYNCAANDRMRQHVVSVLLAPVLSSCWAILREPMDNFLHRTP